MAVRRLEAMEEDVPIIADDVGTAGPKTWVRRATVGLGATLLALVAVAAWLGNAPGRDAVQVKLGDNGTGITEERVVRFDREFAPPLNVELIIPRINDQFSRSGIAEPRGSGISDRACGLTPPRPEDFEEFDAAELDPCNSKCGERLKAGAKCTAFEFRNFRGEKKCRIFKVPIRETRRALGHTCSILGTGGDAPKVDCSTGTDSLDVQEFPSELMAKTFGGVRRCSKDPPLVTKCMSVGQYTKIGRRVNQALRRLGDRCTARRCKQADWAGCVLRMAGHDFMDYDPETKLGGSDACTDMNNPDNRGLAQCLTKGEFSYQDSLAKIYHSVCDTISLADFLVVAAEHVMRRTRENALKENRSAPNVDFQSNFKYGRKTRTSCPESALRLPNPENGCAAVKDTFVDSLGLTWRESAALMGVHTLGRAKVSNSGYSGWWSSPEQSRLFNNDYYKSMVFKGWRPQKSICGNRNKNQWYKIGPQGGGTEQGFRTEMMLDTDLCLTYSVDAEGPVGNERPVAGLGPLHARNNTCCAWFFADPLTDFPNQRIVGTFTEVCGLKSLPSGEPIDDCGSVFQLENFGAAGAAVRAFAEDEAVWLRVFQRAWNKATEIGHTGLKPLEKDCRR